MGLAPFWTMNQCVTCAAALKTNDFKLMTGDQSAESSLSANRDVQRRSDLASRKDSYQAARITARQVWEKVESLGRGGQE
jgi:hypothetical protein